ncbi:hypothetical protein HN51_013023 [Arachis hypogaea]|uniref:Uncharacterized protein n=1 Tax=Arachis hypogaea TaxID=3818 RepID=A0A445DS02_ARAHY|nr:uncharacterized protein LOC112791265 [Arachis hypogaea]XP_029152995.1 uncharacterized protein LOC112791265 [Arachis hypogaea]QHO58636.1 uncharacterized protein DS421_3g92300 [Arachis hypogaea]RYR65964.1 hypothetical protein Ahy_A03g011889 [Arachis hypogaea]
MVTEENFSDRVLNFNTRPALSDVTNRPSKRPFSSISGDSPRKTTSDGDSHFAKKKFHFQLGAKLSTQFNDNDKLQFPEKGKNPSLSFLFCDAVSDASLRTLSSQTSDPQTNNLPEGQNFFGGAGVTSLGLGNDVLDRNPSGVPEGIPITEGFSNRVIQNDDTEVCVDKLASSKSVAVEPPVISASHDFGFPGLERCSALKGVSGANPSVDSVDLLKQCTCSFCSKAAYIWSDLHYQDVKGRLSALKKSQKEASTTLQRFSDLKEKLVHDPQSSTESSKLELTLMEQWKSLFVHMGNTFAQETKQLESKFEELRDLRESCKSSLDSTDNSNSDNH